MNKYPGYQQGNYGFAYGGHYSWQPPTQYYNNFKAHDDDNAENNKHPKDWWNHLKKDQFDGMIGANRYDHSWKDKFESQYSREERDAMSTTQKNKAIKEILDDTAQK